MKKHIKIFTGDTILVNRLAFILEENNISSLIKNNVASANIAGFGSPSNNVILYVFKTDFNKATLLIQEYLDQQVNH